MAKEDKMTLTILEDGTAKLEVDGISAANHTSADRIVKEFAAMMGGPLKIEHSTKKHSHQHQHGGVKHEH